MKQTLVTLFLAMLDSLLHAALEQISRHKF